MLMPNQHPPIKPALDVVTPIPVLVAQPLGKSVTTTMVLGTLQHCVENPTLSDAQLIHPASREIQAGPAGPVATDAPADFQAEAGSPTEATPTAPTEISSLAAVPHKTATKEDFNAEGAALHLTGIRLAI